MLTGEILYRIVAFEITLPYSQTSANTHFVEHHAKRVSRKPVERVVH